ncbi:MAG TPA: GNAT family protein [Aliidongia sp.]|uniref:GNAT family N-acetyltransferase n=1 Tax=Aliidongia sp. TaxID=1914230 RepID=UPI002DDD475F|nr:GNAT family protein [Aliidongia sp.]HEV2674674.1 GNAT family protein [Aliidongia sp.]
MAEVLSGSLVTLQPLDLAHERALLAAASDGELWSLAVTVVPNAATMRSYIEHALDGRDRGTVLPYAIVDRTRDRVVGSTRFWKIDRANRKLEIGHTWLAASTQRTGINTETKYLMLRHAFEVLDCVRVQFTTDELNARSRAAILRLGAVEEGTVRHERIMPDGRKRNSVRFSIIDAEWPAVRDGLRSKLTGSAAR